MIENPRSSYFHIYFTSPIVLSVKFICTTFLLLSALAWSESAESLLNSANRAINHGLWDVAILRLKSATELKTLNDSKQTEAKLLLAESLVRGNRPDQALQIVDEASIKESARAIFWRGQALAGKGRFADAVDTLLPLVEDQNATLRVEAGITAASLKLSMGSPEESLTILDLLENPEKPVTSIAARLKRIEILIDLDRIAQAREIFPENEEIPLRSAPRAKFLDASILLSEGKPTEAEPLFKQLTSTPQGQTTERYHLAALGYADSLAQQGNTEAATTAILTFIQENPSSPLLAPMFQRIVLWFPEEMISEENQTLATLDQWLPQTAPIGTGLINTRFIDAVATFPFSSSKLTDLEVFSLHTKALGLRRVSSERARLLSYSLLQRIPILAPRHFLAPRSILELGKWQIADGKPDRAALTLASLRGTTISPLVKGEAAFLSANIALEGKDYNLASTLYQEAASLLSGENANHALLNSALAKLKKDPTQKVLISTENPQIDEELNTDLQLEKALLEADPAKAKNSLSEFLTAHPNHPRASEIRLAIAESALSMSPADPATARAQLDALEEATQDSEVSKNQKFALLNLRTLDFSGEIEPITAAAKQLIADFPETPEASEASFILGKTLFKTGNYNEARLLFEKIASKEPSTQRSQAALLLAARSAALGATQQSREEALLLFDKTIALDGSLTPLAKLEKARLSISLNRIPDAIKTLQETYQSLSKQDPTHYPTGLLLAEAIYAQGESNPEQLAKTLKIYRELLENIPQNTPRNFRIQYLLGLTLEKLPRSADPAQTRTEEALSTYFSVLDRPTDPPPPEWEWFYKSGFRALLILEKQERWQAAIALAEKIASFGGPRTEDAATRARELRLKHMIWED